MLMILEMMIVVVLLLFGGRTNKAVNVSRGCIEFEGRMIFFEQFAHGFTIL